MTPTANVDAAYAECRAVAKREAKNFYAAFRVLPKVKSDAMCAVYAFMRRADDLADDEAQPIAERRAAMAAWLAAWRASRAGTSADPVFLALNDTQRRFGISDALLEDLVRGTGMDLQETQPGVSRVDLAGINGTRELQVYDTFADLYRYCYLVASVVGLVCIRIFGYSDPRAELLAEKTGVAFQLTNILRDIKEDAGLGRIYLSRDLLGEFGVDLKDVLTLADGRALAGNERALISAVSTRAWEYYAAANELLPLIDPDSRAALWVLVQIYSRLLKRIDAMHGDVFSARASVPNAEKVQVLLRGAVMAARGRLG